MKHKLLILTFFVMASISSHGESATPTPNEHEKRIMVILDTLKDNYYWQFVPSNLMGHLPPHFSLEAELAAHPYRIDRNNYLQELDSLLDKDLSEAFLIYLVKEKYRLELEGFVLPKVTQKLCACQTDTAYAATYRFVAANLQYYKIAIKLVKSGRYKDEIRNCVIQTPVDDKSIKFLYHYLRVFDKETDKQLLDKTVNYVKANLEANPFTAFLKAGVIAHGYYQKEQEAFENEKSKGYREKMQKLTASKEFDEARDNYWRSWAENVLQYYETHGLNTLNEK